MRARSFQSRLPVMIILSGVLLKAACLQAEETTPPRVVSVMEAVEQALKNNHEIRAQENALLAQEADVGAALSHLLPKVTLEERYSLTTNPGYAFFSKLNQGRITMQDFNPEELNNPERIRDFQTALNVEQPVFVKQAYLGLGLARREKRARQEDLRRKREEIAYQVLKAACTVTSAREFVRASGQAVDEAREHERVARLRYANGLGQYADTLRAATALSQALQRRNVAEKNLALARRYLGLLMAADGPVDIGEAELRLPEHEVSFYQESARTRSDLNAAGLRSLNAKESIRLAEARYWPSVGVGGTYQFNDHDRVFGSEGTSWQVGAYLRWDLFDGAKREYDRAKARHQSEQSREAVAAMQDGIGYRIAEAYADVQEARANSALARQALETAEEGARLVRLRYTNGLATLADLLNTQTALEEARVSAVERENAVRTAQATLSFESGAILPDLGIRD